MARAAPANGVEALQRLQDAGFGTGAAAITGAAAARRFLGRVGIALRYGPTTGLPLASLYRAFGGVDKDRATLARCIALTNQLLGEAVGIEVYVIANRLTVVHRSLVPALYALVRRGRPPDDISGLSAQARIALALLRQTRQASAGDVRRRLGVPFDARHDAAYEALGELARMMLVDRGPFEIPEKGIPYLSTEGYPYHLFHELHSELADAARRYSPTAAAETLVEGYLRGAVFARVRKLGTLFRGVLPGEQIAAALRRLQAKGTIVLSGAGPNAIVVCAGRGAASLPGSHSAT